MTNNELKPCPFCGGEAVKKQWFALFHEEYTDYTCCCVDCGITTKSCETEQEAIESWNRRVGEADGSEQT